SDARFGAGHACGARPARRALGPQLALAPPVGRRQRRGARARGASRAGGAAVRRRAGARQRDRAARPRWTNRLHLPRAGVPRGAHRGGSPPAPGRARLAVPARIGEGAPLVGAVEGLAPPQAARRPLLAFPPRPIRRERWPRRVLARGGGLHQWAQGLLDRLVSPALNPLYHSGTIAVFSLAVATVTGLYLFLFYRVGTEAAHRSIEGIMTHPLGIGALVRSLHRYASDAAILAAALHGLKMLLDDRFS